MNISTVPSRSERLSLNQRRPAIFEETDDALVMRSQLGEQEAMNELIDRHYRYSLSVARLILHDAQESEDAVQTAYSNAFCHLNQFRHDARFKTWITRIVINQCMMYLRRVRRLKRLGLEQLAEENQSSRFFTSSEPTPEELALHHERSRLLSRMVQKLPNHLRQVYILRAAGLSLGEIASKLGISVAAAKMRVFRSHSILRLHMERVI